MRPPRFLEGLRPTLHIAHRGGALLAPENTLPAFEQAARLWRTDVFELDVQRTRDGALVVAHDPTLERCTDGAGRIADHTLAELERLDAGHRFSPDGGRTFPFRGRGVRLVTLRALLRAFPGMRLNVELKPESAGSEEDLAALLRAEGALERVCLGSEADAVGARLHALLPDACHFYPREALTGLVMALKLGAPPPEEDRFHVLDMPTHHEGLELVDAPFLAAAAARGRWVNVWTVDAPEQMRHLVGLGVGGVMTDRPDLLRAVLDAGA